MRCSAAQKCARTASSCVRGVITPPLPPLPRPATPPASEGSADGDSTIKVEEKEIKVGVNPDLLSQMERMIPLGRVGTPEEAAGAVYLFCAPESNFISGQHVICGGGFVI